MRYKSIADKLKGLRSGSLEIRSSKGKSVVMTFKENSIDVNFTSPLPVKLPKQDKGLLTKLSQAKDFAEKLRDENVTLQLLRKGKPVMKLGKKANPKFSRLVTRSKAVEISNVRDLRRLDKELLGEEEEEE